MHFFLPAPGLRKGLRVCACRRLHAPPQSADRGLAAGCCASARTGRDRPPRRVAQLRPRFPRWRRGQAGAAAHREEDRRHHAQLEKGQVPAGDRRRHAEHEGRLAPAPRSRGRSRSKVPTCRPSRGVTVQQPVRHLVAVTPNVPRAARPARRSGTPVGHDRPGAASRDRPVSSGSR